MKLSYEQALEVKGYAGMLVQTAVRRRLDTQFLKGKCKQTLGYIGLLLFGGGGLVALVNMIDRALSINGRYPLPLDQTLGLVAAVALVLLFGVALIAFLVCIYFGYCGLTEFSRQYQLYLGRAFKEEIEL